MNNQEPTPQLITTQCRWVYPLTTEAHYARAEVFYAMEDYEGVVEQATGDGYGDGTPEGHRRR